MVSGKRAAFKTEVGRVTDFKKLAVLQIFTSYVRHDYRPYQTSELVLVLQSQVLLRYRSEILYVSRLAAEGDGVIFILYRRPGERN